MEITKKELANALHDVGVWPLNKNDPPWKNQMWSEPFARDILDKIGQRRQKEAQEADHTAEVVPEADTKVTEEELAAALRRIGMSNPVITASRYVANVLAHREPEWQPGDLARSRDGVVVERTSNDEWKLPGQSDNVFTRYIPKKPLKLLKEV